MMHRRKFLMGVASLTLGRTALSQTSSSKGTLRAWAMPTKADPGAGLPAGYPLDHTSVSGVVSGVEWGCYGRTPSDPQAVDKRVIAEGEGDELWAAAIGGKDGYAGIKLGITGACQQNANRLLLPAGIDVDKAHGNELATPVFGKFGFGIPDLLNRIKDGAHTVNKEHPGRISEKKVAAVIQHIKSNNTEELPIMERYLEQTYRPVVGPRWPACKADLSHVYFGLFNYREALYSQYSKGHITDPQMGARLQAALTAAVQLVIEILSPETMARISEAPAAVQAAFVFRNR